LFFSELLIFLEDGEAVVLQLHLSVYQLELGLVSFGLRKAPSDRSRSPIHLNTLFSSLLPSSIYSLTLFNSVTHHSFCSCETSPALRNGPDAAFLLNDETSMFRR
jgi:hypothetical protein